VPATRGDLLLFPQPGRAAEEIAAGKAQAAEESLRAAGINVSKSVVGSADPVEAIADELAAQQDYVSILISTHPARVSRWIKDDVPGRARGLGLPVMHFIVRSIADQLPQGPSLTSPI
jgi:GABA permease